MRLVKNAILAACLLLAPLPAAAAEPHLALVRVESLDALLADVERLAALAGREMSREQLLAPVAGATGGADLSWVDGRKPWVALASMAVLAQGPQALVVAIPARDEGTAVAALGELFAAVEPDMDGVRTLAIGTGPPAAVVFRDGYLVASPSRELALAFRPQEVLARGDLPPGNLAVDVFLEAVAPMALSGLDAARRMMEQRMAAAGGEAAGEAPEGGAEPAGPDLEAGGTAPDEPPVEEPPAAPEMDSAALGALIDLYVDVLRNLIRNSSRLQISIELGGEHLIVHQRVLPLAGSTLEGLLAAQQGGLPALARLIDPQQESFALAAGQVTLTPAFLAAMKEFLGRYAVAMETLFAGLGDSEETAAMAPWLRAALLDVERWPDCYRGDFAGSFDVDPQSGFRGLQVVGARDPALCQELLDQLVELADTLPAGEGGEPAAEITTDTLVYKGVRAMGYKVDLGEITKSDEAEPSPPAWLGEALSSYTGVKDDLILSATGRDAADAFRRLVDRTAAEAPAAGITAAEFVPLATGPGLFAAVDLSRLTAMVPTEAGDRSAELFARLGGGGGRFVYGLHLGTDALHAQLALPLALISAAAASGGEEMEQPQVSD